MFATPGLDSVFLRVCRVSLLELSSLLFRVLWFFISMAPFASLVAFHFSMFATPGLDSVFLRVCGVSLLELWSLLFRALGFFNGIGALMCLIVVAQASSRWYKTGIDSKPPKPRYICPSGLVLSVVSSPILVTAGTVIINHIKREEGSSTSMVVSPYLQIRNNRWIVFKDSCRVLGSNNVWSDVDVMWGSSNMKSYGQELLGAVTSRSEVDVLWSGFRVGKLVPLKTVMVMAQVRSGCGHRKEERSEIGFVEEETVTRHRFKEARRNRAGSSLSWRSEVDVLWSGFRVSELVMWSMDVGKLVPLKTVMVMAQVRSGCGHSLGSFEVLEVYISRKEERSEIGFVEEETVTRHRFKEARRNRAGSSLSWRLRHRKLINEPSFNGMCLLRCFPARKISTTLWI
ncbi:hypothetical protein F2Q69_00015354 [Brassica cretica]|uniref:Uncharacterized protein n=1 Tax=Brassica cretica TaxID=69181 RepID=A0A8S9QZW0_BRACR|nr:hypothetical protein F2Q69_00015354 [Brassica cretica]